MAEGTKKEPEIAKPARRGRAARRAELAFPAAKAHRSPRCFIAIGKERRLSRRKGQKNGLIFFAFYGMMKGAPKTAAPTAKNTEGSAAHADLFERERPGV